MLPLVRDAEVDHFRTKEKSQCIMRNVCIMTEDERNQHTSEQHKLTERFITPVTLACIDLARKN